MNQLKCFNKRRLLILSYIPYMRMLKMMKFISHQTMRYAKWKQGQTITKQRARISRLNCEHLWCDKISKCCELSLKNEKSCSCHLSNNLLTHVINLVNISPTQHIAIKQYLKNQWIIMRPQIKKQEGSHNEIFNKSSKAPFALKDSLCSIITISSWSVNISKVGIIVVGSNACLLRSTC